MKFNYKNEPLNVVQLYDDIDNSFYIVTFADNDQFILYSNNPVNDQSTVWSEASGKITARSIEIGKLIADWKD